MNDHPAGDEQGGAAEARIRILVVEDEPIQAMLLGEVLQGLGHEVCAIVPDEEQAVAAAALLAPDLVIVDVQLAAGTGVTAMARILRARKVAYLYVTGGSCPHAARRIGAVVIRKPFNEAELASAIRCAIA